MIPEIKGAKQTGFFVILGHFLPFHPPGKNLKKLKSKFKKIEKTHLEISFYTCAP